MYPGSMGQDGIGLSKLVCPRDDVLSFLGVECAELGGRHRAGQWGE